jgi:hypothetical protein
MDTRKAAAEYRLGQWTQRLQEQKASGLSITAWCEQTGVPRWQYFYWQRRIRTAALVAVPGAALAVRTGEELAPTFVPVAPGPEPPESAIQIRLKNAEVTISGTASPTAIKAVLRALR